MTTPCKTNTAAESRGFDDPEVLAVLNAPKGSRIVPVGRNLLLLRCSTGEEVTLDDGRKAYRKGNLYLTDQRGTHSQWFEILAVGNACKYFLDAHVGGFITLPELDTRWIKNFGQGVLLANERVFEQDKGPPLMVIFS